MLNWIQTNGQYVAFFAQIVYWAVVAVVSVYAVLLFKRLVDFKTGVATPAPKEKAEKAVSVDEFTD